MTASLPPELREALERRAAGQPGAGLRASASLISRHYRARGRSADVVGEGGEALAYALSRMPATYAAVGTVLDELAARAPDFAPETLLDAGTGPGTAAWAAEREFPSLRRGRLRDTNPAFLALASAVGEETSRLEIVAERADLRVGAETPADLVTCAYALTELAESDVPRTAEALWTATAGALVLVEPGRPQDYERLMAARTRLVALGAQLLAPCPHDRPCPLTPPDWCHFAVRLPRLRRHMHLKGGTLGYEDEKFSYLVAARPGIGTAAPGRVIRSPLVAKPAVTLSICAQAGLQTRVVPNRAREAFRMARKAAWGDPISGAG
ncbi:MAG TPA: small ribosomal subunit Rsm22 family protein [Devosia sp.]|nr:small ribosomal subunit Rsm22 family protein [Devosia sp.]